MCVNFNLFCIFLIEKQRGPARHPQAASAGRRAVATHLLNKGVTSLTVSLTLSRKKASY